MMVDSEKEKIGERTDEKMKYIKNKSERKSK